MQQALNQSVHDAFNEYNRLRPMDDSADIIMRMHLGNMGSRVPPNKQSKVPRRTSSLVTSDSSSSDGGGNQSLGNHPLLWPDNNILGGAVNRQIMAALTRTARNDTQIILCIGDEHETSHIRWCGQRKLQTMGNLLITTDLSMGVTKKRHPIRSFVWLIMA